MILSSFIMSEIYMEAFLSEQFHSPTPYTVYLLLFFVNVLANVAYVVFENSLLLQKNRDKLTFNRHDDIYLVMRFDF